MHKLPRANAINSLPISLNFHKNHLKPPSPLTLNYLKTAPIPPKEKLTNQPLHKRTPTITPAQTAY